MNIANKRLTVREPCKHRHNYEKPTIYRRRHVIKYATWILLQGFVELLYGYTERPKRWRRPIFERLLIKCGKNNKNKFKKAY